MSDALEWLARLVKQSVGNGFDGYCTDCKSSARLFNGRCGCGSGRVATPASMRLPATTPKKQEGAET